MTIEQAATEVVNVRLVQPNYNFHSLDRVKEIVIEVSKEIAIGFGFNQTSEEGTLDAGIKELLLPLPARATRKVVSFSINGIPLEEVKTISELRSHSADMVENPSVYYFDTRLATPKITFEPSDTYEDMRYELQYVASPYVEPDTGIYRKPGDESQIWGTVYNTTTGVWTEPVYENYHEAVVLGATMREWRNALEWEKAEYYKAQYREKLIEFANYLGNIDIAKALRQLGTAEERLKEGARS